MAKQEHRYKLIYDHDDEHPRFETDDLEAAKKAAIEDCEHRGYYVVEIYDSVENRIVSVTPV